MKNTRAPTVLILGCLLILFAPGIGDLRWVGFVGFLYVGIPWYILAVKDTTEQRLIEGSEARNSRIQSITLFLAGLASLFIGVSIDLFIVYRIYIDPSHIPISQALLRLLPGIPFFGFGAYLVHLSLGIARKGT